ncbi:MAG: hypothetical protein JEZ14_08120 [Marinilabiliaceae bacterium]|nr:hypothetical protein [Marinilabiliaceae bacterium]
MHRSLDNAPGVSQKPQASTSKQQGGSFISIYRFRGFQPPKGFDQPIGTLAKVETKKSPG